MGIVGCSIPFFLLSFFFSYLVEIIILQPKKNFSILSSVVILVTNSNNCDHNPSHSMHANLRQIYQRIDSQTKQKTYTKRPTKPISDTPQSQKESNFNLTTQKPQVGDVPPSISLKTNPASTSRPAPSNKHQPPPPDLHHSPKLHIFNF
ncbi:hypothetical protein DFP73DRAFT_566491 [Morchella snyderi]|nr:hypothetical protein DFP73DRAFT_566491 [Morchella snyderi]